MDNKIIAQQRADLIQAFYNEVKFLEDNSLIEPKAGSSTGLRVRGDILF